MVDKNFDFICMTSVEFFVVLGGFDDIESLKEVMEGILFSKKLAYELKKLKKRHFISGCL